MDELFVQLIDIIVIDISTDEFEDIKFLFQGKINKRKLRSLHSCRELFHYLLERGIVAEDNVTTLRDILGLLKKNDLMNLLDRFLAIKIDKKVISKH